MDSAEGWQGDTLTEICLSWWFVMAKKFVSLQIVQLLEEYLATENSYSCL